MDFKNIEKQYYPTPFWSWNEKLNTDETAKIIKMMNDAHLGGFFIRAHSGLKTRYLGDEWFRNVSAALNEKKQAEMSAWICDGNAMCGGFGDGSVSSLGIDFQRKFLRYEVGEGTNDRTITYKDGYHFYYDVNPFCVDPLNEKAAEEIIRKVYEPYWERFGEDIDGFFMEKPQFYDDDENCIPWSFVLPSAYKNEYGEELLDRLAELFKPVGNYKDTRLKFRRLVTKLFAENCVKKFYDWCLLRNIRFSGYLNEDKAGEISGSFMPYYEYFTMPATECSKENEKNRIICAEAVSAAKQLGKEDVLCITDGKDLSFDELWRICAPKMLQGVTKIALKNQQYSLRRERKHDFSRAVSYGEPRWEKYAVFNEVLARMSKLLSQGKENCDTLLLHNTSSVWICTDEQKNGEAQNLFDALSKDCETLFEKHIPFHLGDEMLMEKYAYVDKNELVVGKMRYKNIVIPENNGFFESTQRLLEEFEHGGGYIVKAKDLKENDICDSPDVMYAKREFDDFCVHFFFNNTDEKKNVCFKKGSKRIDLITGEVSDFYEKYAIAPYEMLLLTDDATPFSEKGFEILPKPLEIGGMWNVEDCTQNILCIDKCDVYVNDEIKARGTDVGEVLNITARENEKVRVRCEFELCANYIPEECFLLMENEPDITIKVNGEEAEKEETDRFFNASLTKVPLENLLREGINKISLEKECTLHTEERAGRAEAFFETPFEPLYVMGGFSVKENGDFQRDENGFAHFWGEFSIEKPASRVWLSNLEEQGFWFFAGKITVKKTFSLTDTNYMLSFDKKGIDAAEVRINGQKIPDMIFAPLSRDVSSELSEGTNTVELTFINGFSNLFDSYCGNGEYVFGQIGIENKEN